MNSDFSTLATFAWAGAVLAGVLCFAVGVVVGVMLQRRMSAPADSPAVSGYGRAEVPPPPVGPDDADLDDASSPWARAVVDRLAALLRERASAAAADRSQGWDAPGALDELRAVTRAGRHAAGPEVTP